MKQVDVSQLPRSPPEIPHLKSRYHQLEPSKLAARLPYPFQYLRPGSIAMLVRNYEQHPTTTAKILARRALLQAIGFIPHPSDLGHIPADKDNLDHSWTCRSCWHHPSPGYFLACALCSVTKHANPQPDDDPT